MSNRNTYNDDFFMEAARRIISEHFGYDFSYERRGKWGEYYPCFYPAGKTEAFQRAYKIPDITFKDESWFYEYGYDDSTLFGTKKQQRYDHTLITLVRFLQKEFPRDYQKEFWFKGE